MVDDGLSSNGTFVRGERVVGPRRLADGDVFRVGRTTFAFRDDGRSAPATTRISTQHDAAVAITEAQGRVLIALCRPFKGGRSDAMPATNPQIAAELFLTVAAVKTPLRALCRASASTSFLSRRSAADSSRSRSPPEPSATVTSEPDPAALASQEPTAAAFTVGEDGLHAGDSLGGYVLESELARGGMGVVYRARDEALGRTVALKVIAPGLAQDSSFRQRFEREWRAAARLEHPNAVAVYRAGEDDGRLFLAMRFIDGRDLATSLFPGPADGETVREVVDRRLVRRTIARTLKRTVGNLEERLPASSRSADVAR